MRYLNGRFLGRAAVLLWASCSSPGVRTRDGAPATGGGDAGTGGGGNPLGGSGGFVISKDKDGSVGGGGAGGMGGSELSADANCGYVHVDLDRLTPEIMLVFDRSGSMKATDVVPTRWEAATDAINKSLADTTDVVLWGLKLFPTDAGCAVSNAMEADVALNNYTSALAPAIAGTAPNAGAGGTPTQFAVHAASEYLKTRKSPNPKYILLATDGEPTCTKNQTGCGAELDYAACTTQAADDSVKAIEEAAAAGFHTFVVGIAITADAKTILNNMANAGLEPQMGATKYYPVASQTGLSDALKKITKHVATCLFPLEKKPLSPNDVKVTIDGVKVERDTTGKDGWNYTAGMAAVEIYGPKCDALKTSTTALTKVEIIFGCPDIEIP